LTESKISCFEHKAVNLLTVLINTFQMVLKIYVYVAGITALEMAEGKPPYGDIHPMRVRK